MNNLQIDIESNAGFCPGVVKAIEVAERELQNRGSLYCLGELVHNPAEVERLKHLGLHVIDRATFGQLKNENVLLRSHGEPPETYKIAERNNIRLIDTTCKIVGNLQKKVEKAYQDLLQMNGHLVIYGKKDHPETIGLKGVTDDTALVISKPDDIDLLDFSRPIRLFSQTTMDPQKYEDLVEMISKKSLENNTDFDYQASVCGWMSKRVKNLRLFSVQHDLIIFVAGEESSNGKFLFGEVKIKNPRAYKISGREELKEEWFTGQLKIGISGATSTPLWQLQEIKEAIKSFYVS